MESINQILMKNINTQHLTSEKSTSTKLKTCEKCGGPIEKEIEILGKVRIVPIICKCKKEEIDKKRIEEENKEKQNRLERLFTNSLMDKKFRKETFSNWDDKVGDKGMKNMGIKYCKNFNEVKKQGLGFLLTGTPGNGKTYLSNCIANELLSKGFPVICVSINSLLERIRKTYNDYGREGEDEILRGLSNADLLIIDDLGTEQKTEWSCSKIYNIIDNRYRNGLPLIVSTNKTIENLKEQYHERTIDRLLEICTLVENKNKSIRKEKAERNKDLLRNIISGK